MNHVILGRRSCRTISALVLSVAIPLCLGGQARAQIETKRIQVNTAFAAKTVDPLKKINTTSGFGASVAHARAGGNAAGVGATLDPPANAGGSFDNLTIFGPNNAKIQALTPLQTSIVGLRLLDSYPNTPVPAGGERALGQGIAYNRDISTDKVTPALQLGINKVDATAGAEAQKTDAYGEGSLVLTPNAKNNKAVDVEGFAKAQISDDNPLVIAGANQKAFAIGIIKDPITYALVSPSDPGGAIDVSLGDDGNLLSLQAGGANSFAEAFYDFGTDQTGTLLSFSLGIDFTTASKQEAVIDVDTLDPRLGFATSDDFKNYLLSYLVFDPNAHSLTALSGIPLYEAQLQTASPSVTLSFTGGAIVGDAVPEPGGAAAVGVALVLLCRCLARQRRPE